MPIAKSDDPEVPPATGAQRDRQGRSVLGDLITWAWLPPDVLVTWWERILAVLALVLIGYLLFDIAWHEL
jgi:hypothetical protein